MENAFGHELLASREGRRDRRYETSTRVLGNRSTKGKEEDSQRSDYWWPLYPRGGKLGRN